MEKKYRQPEHTIPLFRYQYHHSPIANDFDEDDRFIGRSRLVDEIRDLLTKTKDSRGTYLITGYRGSGKTSLINKCIALYKKDNKTTLPVRVNLGNDTPLDPKTALKQIVYELYNGIQRKREELSPNNAATSSLPYVAAIFIMAGIAGYLFYCTDESVSTPYLISRILFVLTASATISTILFSIFQLHDYFLRRDLFKIKKIEKRIKRLYNSMDSSTEKNISSNAQVLNFGSRESIPPKSANQIESELISIFSEIRRPTNDKNKKNENLDVIVIFDELDKITGSSEKHDDIQSHAGVSKEIYQRKKQVDQLLGALKNFLTSAEARFIFISGREMLDAYLGERISTTSLYESLFNKIYYVPSLLTDDSDGDDGRLASMTEYFLCKKLMDREHLPKDKSDYDVYRLHKYHEILLTKAKETCKKEDRKFGEEDDLELKNTILFLRNFVHFLTFHAWGNPKRLISLFESFVHPASIGYKIRKNNPTPQTPQFVTLHNKAIGHRGDDYAYVLHFNVQDIQRIILGSNLYIIFHHQLSRTLRLSDDKLVVSSFAALHNILKFHKNGFSRRHLDRMAESLNIHSSPELNKVVNIILGSVFRAFLHRIRNGLYRYRFTSLFQQEIRYITEISDIESAAFNFSLDSNENIKQHYLSKLDHLMDLYKEDKSHKHAIASSSITIANLYYWEQHFDDAEPHFLHAMALYKEDIERKTCSLSALTKYVEASLKLGNLEERRYNYSHAASLYAECARMVANHVDAFRNLRYALQTGDSKYDVLKQPFWSMAYLNLKRSPSYWREKNRIEEMVPDYFSESPSYYFKMANLQFLLNDFKNAKANYYQAAKISSFFRGARERSGYLGGNALIRLALSNLIGYFSKTGKNIYVLHAQTDLSLSGSRTSQYRRSRYGYLGVVKNLMNGIDEAKTLTDFIESVCAATNPADNDKKDRDIFEIKPEIVRLLCVKPQSTNDSGDIENHEDDAVFENNIDQLKLKHIIGLLAVTAKILEKTNLYASAANCYITIIMVWGAVLELVPTRSLKGKDKRNFKHKLRHANGWVEEVLDSAFTMISNAYSKSFSHFHDTWRTRDLGPSSKSCGSGDAAVYGGFSTANPFKVLRNRDKTHYAGASKENIFWQHSIIGQLLIELSIWEIRSRQAITGENNSDVIKDISIDYTIPFGVRPYSVALWLSGRNALRQLKIRRIDFFKNLYSHLKHRDPANPIHDKDLPKLEADAWNHVIEEAAYGIELMYRASQYIKQSSGNDQEIMFPPQYFVFYKLWEILFEVALLFPFREGGISCPKKEEHYGCLDCEMTTRAEPHKEDSEEMISIAQHVIKDSIIGKVNDDVATNFAEILYVRAKAIETLRSADIMNDINAKPRTDVLQSKYYLDDDHDDHFFIMDWFFFQVFSGSGSLHIDAMEESHRMLTKLYESILNNNAGRTLRSSLRGFLCS